MQPQRFGQWTPHGVKSHKWDMFLCASGFERRAGYVASRFGAIASYNAVWAFDEYPNDPSRLGNDAMFSRLGFHTHRLSGDSDNGAEEAFAALCSSMPAQDLNVLIDISSMTRSWYGGILRSIRKVNDRRSVKTCFLYAPARFSPPRQQYPQNRFVGPVPGFAGLVLPDEPSALVVGLGHDHGRALGMLQELDPESITSFVARPGLTRAFEKSALRANRDFLAFVPPTQQFEYPIMDFNTLFHRLHSVTRWLGHDSAVVLAPLGPKVFALASFLVAMNDPRVSVWRITAGPREGVSDRTAAGPVVAVMVEWGRGVPRTFEEVVESTTLASQWAT